MQTTTFKELLSTNNCNGIENILIPKIQRSYAQGRTDQRTTKTRERFLKSIHDKITAGKQLTLDFIYGNVKDGCLVALEGQQRLTTLWLLHWYAAKKENVATEILNRFSYNTRISARDFIERMTSYIPKWEGKLSEEIRNEGWFPLDWTNDPTVSGMFVMLDDIHEQFGHIENLWSKLDLINFHFLPLEELNLTDEIYIKMNSRGKPLTEFEHFKAELLKTLRNIPEVGETIANRIGRKIDIDWTDLLWNYRGADNLIDDEFLRYFRFVCHLITYHDGRSFNEEVSGLDEFDLIKEFFTGKNAIENVAYLESLFDIWVEFGKNPLDGSGPTPITEFFSSYLSLEHEAGKAIPLGNDIDLFGSILKLYPNFRNPNVLQWMTTLYCFVVYLQNSDKISDKDFRRRLRIIINLQHNSGNEIVDTPKADAGNRMPAILKHVERILLTGVIEKNIEIDGKERPTFSVSQLKEEAEKLEFTKEQPQNAEPLFKLEDHPLLQGRTSIVGYRNSHLYGKFSELFAGCTRDAIDCAMLAVTNYSQRRTVQTIQLGSGNEENPGFMSWYDLFHPSEKIKNAESTSLALRTVLERFDNFNDESLYAFARKYVADCEAASRFDWRYYYIKYDKFRIKTYGRYTQMEDSPYELVAIFARKYESENAYQCFLGVLSDEIGGRIDDRRWLAYKDGWLHCKNDSFQYYGNDRETLLGVLPIPQEDGIDTVNRIEYFGLMSPQAFTPEVMID